MSVFSYLYLSIRVMGVEVSVAADYSTVHTTLLKR